MVGDKSPFHSQRLGGASFGNTRIPKLRNNGQSIKNRSTGFLMPQETIVEPLTTPQGQRRRGVIIFLLIAAVGMPYGAYHLLDYWRFAFKAHEAPGFVVARDSSSFTIQFAVNGRTFQIDEALPGTKGMGRPRRSEVQPGFAVMVLYDPSSPQKARWKNDRNWLVPLATLLISAICGLAYWFPNAASRPLR